MSIGQVGPFTTAIETMATAVGAGILLGSFAMGAIGLLAGRPRRVLEARGLTDGYYGGLFAIGFVLVDLALRYGG
jgi:hypothetical protein